MKTTGREKQHAIQWLQKEKIDLKEMAGFRFMQRLHPEKNYIGKEKYGPGILIFRKKSHEETDYIVKGKTASCLIKYLEDEGLSFLNHRKPEPRGKEPEEKRYRQYSLYLLYFASLTALFIAFCIASFCEGFGTFSTIKGAFGLALGAAGLYLTGTLFAYIHIRKDRMEIVSLGKKRVFEYGQLKKVNFEFSRLMSMTIVAEILDINDNYHLYYIGRTPVAQLPHIAHQLREQGVDATCSLNTKKRYYGDIEAIEEPKQQMK